jgi:hypothetical protein
MHSIVKFIEQVPAWFADLYASLVSLVAAHLYPVVLVSAALLALGTYGLGRMTGRRDQHAADKAAMGDSYVTGYTDGVTKEHDVTEDARGQRHVCADGVLRGARDLGGPGDWTTTLYPSPPKMNVETMSLTDDGQLLVSGTVGGVDTRVYLPKVERASFSVGVDHGATFTGVAGVAGQVDAFGDLLTREAAQTAVAAWNEQHQR